MHSYQCRCRFYLLLIAILLLPVFLPNFARAEATSPDPSTFIQERSLSAIESLPVMHEGRIKPFDTFARVHLLAMTGKSSLGKMKASEWLLLVLLDPTALNTTRLFQITNPDLISSLKLNRDVSNRYSFLEVFPRIQENIEQIRTVADIAPDKRTAEQTQLMRLQAIVGRYYELAGSLQAILPRFKIHDAQLAEELNVTNGIEYNFLEFSSLVGRVRDLVAAMPAERAYSSLESRDRNLLEIAASYQELESWSMSPIFRVIPPQWQSSGEEWISIWNSVERGEGSPKTAEYLMAWKNLGGAYAVRDAGAFSKALTELSHKTSALGAIDFLRMRLEVFQNRAQLDVWALVAFLITLVFVLIHWTGFGKRIFYKAAMGFMSLGIFCLLAMIGIRMYLMMRPPVTTLYESVLFVSLIITISAFLVERRTRTALGLLTGSMAAVILLFVSFGYAAEGDTLGVLVAVLNTNFWLATHVVCMTVGYGTCVMAAMLGHVYLVGKSFRIQKINLQALYKNMVGMTLVALFFSLFGTILGGIWADQSWGRFWGWDPKENGAMLVVLWLLFLLHGRLGGYLQATGYALGMVLTNIIVALAWFGVNLLSVGLHTYGFTENIALNLLGFGMFELCFGLYFYHRATVSAVEFKLTELQKERRPYSNVPGESFSS